MAEKGSVDATCTTARDEARARSGFSTSISLEGAVALGSAQPHVTVPTVPQFVPFEVVTGADTRSQAPVRASSTRSSQRSTTTVVARKLAAEAELRRRQLERAKKEGEEMERRNREVEELELQATLAAIEAEDSKAQGSIFSYRSLRTRSWVRSTRASNSSDYEPAVAQATLVPQAAAHLGDTMATEPHNPPTVVQESLLPPNVAPLCNTMATVPKIPSDIDKLATAIATLTDSSKRKSLPTFSGQYKEWLTFKGSYVKTQCSYTRDANVARLSDALRGPAREAVELLLHTTDDPEVIIMTLEQTFARPELVVTAEVSAIRSFPKVNSPEQLNIFANKVRNCVGTVIALKQRQYLSSPELYKSVLSKLNELTKARFSDFAADMQDENVTKLETLSNFLLREADRQLKFAYVPDFSASLSAKPNISVSKRETVNILTVNKDPCTYCNEKHIFSSCKYFKSLSVDDRWRWVRENKVCFRCLKGGAHRWNSCKAKRCGIDGCVRRHHALLHGLTNGNVISPGSSADIQHSVNNSNLNLPTEQNKSTCDEVTVSNMKLPDLNVNCNNICHVKPRTLLRILPVVIRGSKCEYETYALLDDGSTATLVDADVASKIGAEEISREPLRIDGVGGMYKQTHVGYIKFYIRGRGMNEEYEIDNARSVPNLSLRSQTIPIDSLRKYKHLVDLVDLVTYEDATPTVLIGAGDWHLSICREVRSGKRSEPVATRTLLGWTLHGSLDSKARPLEFVNYFSMEDEHNSIEALMREQYRLDCIGILRSPPKISEDDQHAIDIIESTARRLPTGRFEVGLPWRRSIDTIPDSYPQALSRYKSLEKQIAKDEGFASAYRSFIKGIIEKGYAEECSESSYHGKDNNDVSSRLRWYLPHFGVYHPQKKKLRVVHDAAAVTNRVSLNSMLLVGPDLLQPLLAILFRFREGKIAVTGDIREMFPQIKIREADRDAQRFLWRNFNHTDAQITSSNSFTINSKIKEYRMSSMIFGAASSPFMALYLKNKNALDAQDTSPEATHEIIYNHYMDDYISSFDDVNIATKVVTDVYNVHKACCFEMRSWLSNHSCVLERIPRDLLANPNIDAILPNDVSMLGIKWNPASDMIGFRTGNLGNSQIKLTKRSILSAVMKVYDPLGLLSPTVIKGRILIQDLWRDKLGWDDELPPRYVSAWDAWVKEISSHNDLRIPRRYLQLDIQPKALELHIFADASEQAFACVAYWRFILGEDNFKLSLIGSKARVSPLKPTTIPRLELQAALIATRLANTIKDSHRLKPSQIIFWTDSTTVLKWLRGDARRYKPFVAHRVGEILESTDSQNWRWVPSEQNVADDATRLTNWTDRWFAGPSFLLAPSKEWPTEPDDKEITPLPDVKEVVGFLVEDLGGPPVPDVSHFSVWLRLLRATAYVLKAVKKFKSFISKSQNSKSQNCNLFSQQISSAEIMQAEKLLILKSQIDSFGQEFSFLSESKPLPKSSRLYAFSSRLQDGLLIMDSRIKALLTEDATVEKSRILLDDRHPIVRLLVAHYHCKAGHGFHELVFNELRQHYWILRGRRAVKSIAAACLECRRRKKLPQTPIFGDLPKERLEHHVRPFTNIGLDYFGPVEVTVGRHHEKRWIALYSCLVTRALHIEIVSSLSSDSAIMSLRRFIARRGCPSKIVSDNGTSFVGANKELVALFKSPVYDFAATNKIQWSFLPPLSPFMAGATERMVRSVKTALKASLRERAPKDEVLSTFLLEAEALCNSRPITYVTTSSDTPEAITPFHFLIGSSSNNQWLVGDLDDSDLVRRTQWKTVLRLADHFWARWMREYLPTLIRRPTSSCATANIKEGDVVVVADATLPRGIWPLGRIIKTYPGQDGVVRVAEVATKGGVLKRPIRKLVPMTAADQAVAIP